MSDNYLKIYVDCLPIYLFDARFVFFEMCCAFTMNVKMNSWVVDIQNCMDCVAFDVMVLLLHFEPFLAEHIEHFARIHKQIAMVL